MKFSPFGTTVDFISPDKRGVMRIKNVKVPIKTSALQFSELKHLQGCINDMETRPDWGYQGDNFIIQEDKKDNWQVLTGIVKSKSKHEWL